MFQVKTGLLFRRYWLYLGAVPMYELSRAMSRGASQLGSWAVINVLPRFFFVISLVILWHTNMLQLDQVCFVFALSYILSALTNLAILQPVFRLDKSKAMNIMSKIKKFGFKVTISNLVFNANISLDRLLISFMLNSEILGIYQFAISVSNPIVMISRSLGISRFKKYISQNSIGSRIQGINLMVLVLQSLLIYYLFPYLTNFLSLDKYLPAHLFLPFILIAHIFLGLKQPYSYYFIAHKWGSELLIISYLTLVGSSIFYIILMYFWGIYGALIGLMITYFILYISIKILYRNKITG